MPYSYPEIKNFQGLFVQANSFTVPDGALEQAENVVIRSDGVVSRRRGFYLYAVSGADVQNKQYLYNNRLLSIFSNKIGYYTDTGSSPNLTGTLTNLTGVTVAVTAPRVSRQVQANKNFYFTTDNGVLKLEDYNSHVFTSGTAPALDLQGYFRPDNGPILDGKVVNYRVVFGRRDANDNLILGAPSDISTLTNSSVTGVSWSRTTNVVTVTSTAHNLASGMTITVSASTGGTPVPDGTYTVTVTGVDTFTFANTAGNSSGVLTYTLTRLVRLEFSVPSDITTTADAYFYQLYRSSQSSSAPAPLDFKLVVENQLTAGEITAHVVVYDDDIDDILLGAELYTNPNSREGELQANFRAPKCQDVCAFKNHVFYANCTTRHLLNLDVVDTSVITATDFIEVKVDSTTLRYVAQGGVGNRTVSATSFANTAGKLEITYAAHGFANGNSIYISSVVGGSLTAGTYFVVNKAANTFQISLTSGGLAIAYSAVTAADFEGVTNGTNPIFYFDASSASISVELRDTAEGIVKAINRDPLSLIFAQYISGTTDIPGQMRFTAKGFTGAIYVRANTTTVGSGFSPPLPSSFASGTQVYSRNESQPNTLYSSKTGEPEAVPIVNNFPVAARNKAILRVAALRDSVIIVKEDGIYRLNGDNPSNFSITALDTTVFCVATRSLDVINNQVVFLSNQGLCLVTESSVQIVSRKIDDLIQPILGKSTLETVTSGQGYESERLYLLTTTMPNSTTADVTYLYNILNNSWSSSTQVFQQAVIGPADTMYLINANGDILKERKTQTLIDYCGQEYAVTVVSVSSDKLSSVVTVTNGIPEAGDVIVKNNVFSRITQVTADGSNWDVTFFKQTNLAAADSVLLYKSYTATIKTAPFHAGAVGRLKQFAQMALHLRNSAMGRCNISFTGQTFGGSEEVEWVSQLTQSGWGQFPWGFEPWGQEDGINLVQGTQPAPVVRIYVPRFQQRNTFIQMVLKNSEAGEAINMQAISWAVRAYGERVTK